VAMSLGFSRPREALFIKSIKINGKARCEQSVAVSGLAEAWTPGHVTAPLKPSSRKNDNVDILVDLTGTFDEGASVR